MRIPQTAAVAIIFAYRNINVIMVRAAIIFNRPIKSFATDSSSIPTLIPIIVAVAGINVKRDHSATMANAQIALILLM